MDLNYTAEQQAFRQEVREFIAAKLPPDIARRNLGQKRLKSDDVRRWQRILFERGWGAPGWSAGGVAGPSPASSRAESSTLARRASRSPSDGHPVIIARTPAQQQYFLWDPDRRALWCQGYPSPAPPDLALSRCAPSRALRRQRAEDLNTLGQYATGSSAGADQREAWQQEGISFPLTT
jgi:alkylation response protein AidB-like acyl-CoA dehydrogenase